MKINEQLTNFENEAKKLMREAKAHIEKLPNGELRNYQTMHNGIAYDKFYVLANGKRKYLPKDDPRIKLLAEKMYYSQLLENAKRNYDEIEYIKNNMPGISAAEILEELPIWSHNLIDIPQSNELLLSPDPKLAKILLDWQNAPYPRKKNRNEGLRHRSLDGTIFRSKSEMLIWEQIKQMKIAHRYECGLEYEPGKWIFPDITMMRTDTKLFYHEHCGLMDNPKYVSDLKWRLGIYERMGIVPWDNLILTFDDVNGNIDMNLIEAILRSKLII